MRMQNRFVGKQERSPRGAWTALVSRIKVNQDSCDADHYKETNLRLSYLSAEGLV